MIDILEYISANYTLFLVIAITILLAIIGSYADKTNFGQGKKDLNESKKEDINKDILNKRISDVISPQKEEDGSKASESVGQKNQNIESSSAVTQDSTNENNNINDKKEIKEDISIQNNNDSQVNVESSTIDSESSDSIESPKEKDLDKQFDKLDEMFDEVLPEKEVISNDLLDEVNNISLDSKTSDEEIHGIPSLDNFDLPEIKDLKTDDGDIWKF